MLCITRVYSSDSVLGPMTGLCEHEFCRSKSLDRLSSFSLFVRKTQPLLQYMQWAHLPDSKAAEA